MGLSTTPKENISFAQSWIDAVQIIQSLLADPKALENMAKDAYRIPEAEEARANEAREKISVYQELVATNKKQLDEIAKSKDVLEGKQSAIDASSKEIDRKKKALDGRESQINEIQKSQKEAADKLQRDTLDLEVKKADHNKDVAALAKREKAINEYESGLKAKAAKLKDLTEDM